MVDSFFRHPQICFTILVSLIRSIIYQFIGKIPKVSKLKELAINYYNALLIKLYTLLYTFTVCFDFSADLDSGDLSISSKTKPKDSF